MALVVGLILGVALALLREHLDDSVKNKEELERVSDGLPTLGIIPVEAGWKDRDEPYVVSRAGRCSFSSRAPSRVASTKCRSPPTSRPATRNW